MIISDHLPLDGWMARDDLAGLLAALGPGQIRWVGGVVRDTLLGRTPHDIDGATPLPPAEVTARLAAAGIKVVPTGIDHGTVTAVLPHGHVEITTLRRDLATDGRRAEIAYSSDWREDAARRDFTINALYADPVTGEVFDWFGGLADLAAHRVRFIGDPHDRIREDYLRILRYFRFQARFGAEADGPAEAACAELASTLKGLSRERVAMELLAILGLPDPTPTVVRMHALGILPEVLPETGVAELAALPRLITAEQAAAIAPDPLRRMAALLPADPPLAEQLAARLRLSARQRKRLACVAARQADDAAQPHALAYRVGLTCAVDRLLLGGANPAPLAGWEAPRLPLKGGQIVAAGIKAGPQVARILQAVETRWVAEGFPDEARVHAILEGELGR